jgi:hypothetical protein
LVPYAEVEIICSACGDKFQNSAGRSPEVTLDPGCTTHESGMNGRHEKLDEPLLYVKSLVQSWESRRKDVTESVLVKEAGEAGIGTLCAEAELLVVSRRATQWHLDSIRDKSQKDKRAPLARNSIEG